MIQIALGNTNKGLAPQPEKFNSIIDAMIKNDVDCAIILQELAPLPACDTPKRYRLGVVRLDRKTKTADRYNLNISELVYAVNDAATSNRTVIAARQDYGRIKASLDFLTDADSPPSNIH